MTNDFLTRNQEQVVGGEYRLGAVIARSDWGAVYETEFGDEARPAVVKIRRADAPDAGRLVAQWRRAIELAHPNLLRVYAAGFSVLDDVPVIFVVMERADESLAGVLAERALSEAETREMLRPALGALKYLHNNGYAHSSLKPSNTLAVGDVLKLSSDSAVPFADGGSPAEDIRALGTVIVQALTRELPKIGEDSGPYNLRDASRPLADIVRHCLDPDPDKRWTADQVEARLAAPPEAPVAPPAVVPAVVPVKVEPVRVEPRRVMRLPVEELRARPEDRGEDAPSRRTPRWIYAALAALVLIVVLAGLWRKQHSGPAATVSTPGTSEVAAALPSPSPEPAVPEVPGAANPALPAEVNPGSPDGRGRREEGWSVIVATYASREPAEKRGEEIARKWPAFKPTVFEQPGEKTYYLVVIGQNLSEDAADALRKRAAGSGLPRDTYIKKMP